MSVKMSNGLPYRSIFAVLTWDSVLVYDTVHAQPMAVARGLHYAHLTDATWSSDGRRLVVCSSDGYISVLNFANGELGQVYTPPQPVTEPETVASVNNAVVPVVATSLLVSPAAASDQISLNSNSKPKVSVPAPASVVVPPCEPGNAKILEGPAAKKQKVRIAPTCIVPAGNQPAVSENSEPDQIMTDDVGQAVDQMSLDEEVNENNVEACQKKRIQPTLLTTS